MGSIPDEITGLLKWIFQMTYPPSYTKAVGELSP
jgi:hypothetical protein